jgi:hypothetical protein
MLPFAQGKADALRGIPPRDMSDYLRVARANGFCRDSEDWKNYMAAYRAQRGQVTR